MARVIRNVALSLAITALALPFLAVAPARAQATRTWVSGTGDDNNNCSRTAPCKTFQGAFSKTAAGGEINCLDPGDFGQVTINFSLTISCEAGTAGIQILDVGFAISISAAATDVVTLRGLDIDGQGTGNVGIFIGSAKAVHIEKCSIRNFRHSFGPGIHTALSSTEFLFVEDTVLSDNTYGIVLSSSGGYKVASLKNVTITGSTGDGLQFVGGNIYANVSESMISGNGGSAVYVTTNTTINIDRSTIANNAIAGLHAEGSGSTIRASGNNIYNNTTGIFIANGGTIQSDGTNKHGNSNGGAQVPNASFAEY